ncbi:MAG TPA: Calx-beta domain-containing protein [Verrucomicrobiae bacterium]|nr:Calx-beta domain-containing protein [Verrucomicrobiae bacterium]
MRSKFSLVVAACVAVLLSFNPMAYATPYASGVRVDAGIVSFILNESADNVTVVFDGGASSRDLGARDNGTHSFNLDAASSFEIVVKKSAPPVWTLISTDTNRLMQFNSGRGVAVNMHSSSPYFGRIYVANSAAGTATGRPVGDGLYIMNADQSDALGRGDTASTAGINFNVGAATPAANSPWHIEVGPDDYLYIADFSTNTGTIYRTDPDVSSGSGQPVLANYGVTNQSVHTTIGSSPIVLGSLATADMVVYAIDGQFPGSASFNTLYRWDIGAGPLPYSAPPTKLANPLINTVVNVTTDLDRAPDGKFFMMQNRSAGNESGIVVVDTDGTTILWRSLQESRVVLNDAAATDILKISRAVKISPDNKKMAIIRDDLQTWIIPLVNGLPDLSQRQVVQTHSGAPTTLGRDISFDAAGNLYALSSGNLLLRIFSPGGESTATTRSDGTFEVNIIELPGVSVTATDNQGAEDGADPATFTLTRSGDLSSPLTVNYFMSGQAANTTDYATIPLSVEFPAGVADATVTITPIDDDVAEFSETVILNLATSSSYALRSPTNATATILDNEFPALRITGGSKTNVYEPLSRDTITLTVSRLGRLDADIYTAEVLSTGTATEGIDFTLSTNFFPFPPNVVNQTVTLTPLNDFDYEGTETMVISVGPGSYDYNIDAQDTVTRWIRDDEQPPAPVLFAEDFTVDPSANWQIRFGANNGIYDANVNWTYDYGPLGIGPAPNTHDGSTLGLFAAVNKDTVGSSAGINLYPSGRTFSGDYALRFDMYLSYGTASTTEHALLGINHSGSLTNRATQSPDANNTTAGGDGFWVGIVTDASNLEDYSGYTYPTPTSLPTIVVRRAASTLTGLITSPPYALAGSPGSVGNSTNKAWSEVELSQVNNLISLKVNDILIWQHQNTNAYTSGNIMLGMNDQFDSVPASNAGQHFVVFDNVRVVNLSTDIRITRVELVGANQVQIDFASPAGGDASGYTLRAKTSLANATWTPDGGATITALGGTEYRALTTRSGSERFYSISKP